VEKEIAVGPAVLIALRLRVITKRAGFRRVTHSHLGVSYHLAALVRVNDVNLRTIKPQL